MEFKLQKEEEVKEKDGEGERGEGGRGEGLGVLERNRKKEEEKEGLLHRPWHKQQGCRERWWQSLRSDRGQHVVEPPSHSFLSLSPFLQPGLLPRWFLVFYLKKKPKPKFQPFGLKSRNSLQDFGFGQSGPKFWPKFFEGLSFGQWSKMNTFRRFGQNKMKLITMLPTVQPTTGGMETIK